MFTDAPAVMKYLADEQIEFLDIRFCDLPGVMQHFNVPAASVDESFFTEGAMFDGSSIRGFQYRQDAHHELLHRRSADR